MLRRSLNMQAGLDVSRVDSNNPYSWTVGAIENLIEVITGFAETGEALKNQVTLDYIGGLMCCTCPPILGSKPRVVTQKSKERRHKTAICEQAVMNKLLMEENDRL